MTERRLTAEEFSRLSADSCDYELSAGLVLAEPFPSFDHDRVRRRIDRLIEQFVVRNRLGEALGHVGFVLARNPDTVRGPDVSFIAQERLSRYGRGPFFPGPPDLAVEVLSPSNRAEEVHAKVADYLAAGCRLVWVVDPGRRLISTYRELLTPRHLTEADTLGGEDVLPGFSVPVRSVFEK